MEELTREEVKGMYEKLCKKISEHAGGVDQYIDFRSIGNRSGFKITKLFRGKNHFMDEVSGRYEVWIETPGWSYSKAGKGNSLGEAVRDAVSSCFIANRIYQEPENA
jgi:hypothetical protein